MTRHQSHIAAPPGDIYWRKEVCPHRGAKVLLRTVGGVCVTGSWYGAQGQYFTAWCPMPKDGEPAEPFDIFAAGWLERAWFALKLIFSTTNKTP